jgi:hypothetical protein
MDEVPGESHDVEMSEGRTVDEDDDGRVCAFLRIYGPDEELPPMPAWEKNLSNDTGIRDRIFDLLAPEVPAGWRLEKAGDTGIRFLGPDTNLVQDVQDQDSASGAFWAVRRMIEDDSAMETTEELVIDVEWDGEDDEDWDEEDDTP